MKSILIILFVTAASFIKAQQLPVYSLVSENKLLINPAVAGSEYYWDFGIQHRAQWIAFDNNPSTQIVSSHSRFSDSKSAIGGYIYNDRSGVLGNLGVNLNYAYHLDLGNDVQLGFGLAASYTQFKLFGNKVTLNDPNDLLINGGKQVKGVFNSNVGGLLYADAFYVGVAAHNLIPNPVNYKSTSVNTPLRTHYYFQAGGEIPIGTNSTLEPAVVLNYIRGNPFQMDFRLTYQYVDIFRVGIGHRLKDALIITAGVKVYDEFYINYAYDLGVSKLAKVHSGSHEIQMTYKFYYNPLMGKDKKRYNLKRVPRKSL